MPWFSDGEASEPHTLQPLHVPEDPSAKYQQIGDQNIVRSPPIMEDGPDPAAPRVSRQTIMLLQAVDRRERQPRTGHVRPVRMRKANEPQRIHHPHMQAAGRKSSGREGRR